jgi:hypothetical protein
MSHTLLIASEVIIVSVNIITAIYINKKSRKVKNHIRSLKKNDKEFKITSLKHLWDAM